MSRSSKRGRSGGSRWQTVGVFLTVLLVAVLVGSLAAGLLQRPLADAGVAPTYI